MNLTDLTRSQIDSAMAECDRLGEPSFLDVHGFGPSLVYRIQVGSKSYPSKAIVGVAAGLTPRDFFGGIAQTVGCLQRLGYPVLRHGRPCPLVQLVKLGRSAKLDRPRATFPVLGPGHLGSFASGSNRPGEIRGLSAVHGVEVGVTATELSAEAVRELLALAGTDVRVFVDSGAFGEVKISPTTGRVTVVKLLTEQDWANILAIYRVLAEALGDQLWCVAPDRVGSQMVTLRRLNTWHAEIRELVELGAHVLMPVQRGLTPAQTFYMQCCAAVRCYDLIPSMPCKKGAGTPHDVAVFLSQPKDDRCPKHVHFLGLGPKNRLAPEYAAAAERFGFSYTTDACWITANVGRKARLRLFSATRDLATELLSKPGAGTVAELGLLIAWGAC